MQKCFVAGEFINISLSTIVYYSWSVCFYTGKLNIVVEDCNTGVSSINSDTVWSAVYKIKSQSTDATEIIICLHFGMRADILKL